MPPMSSPPTATATLALTFAVCRFRLGGAGPQQRRALSNAARAALLNIRGLKRRQTCQFRGGRLNPTKPRLAGYAPQKNALAFGKAFGGHPPNGAPARSGAGASLVQGSAARGGGVNGANGRANGLIQGPQRRRLPPSLLQGRPQQRANVNGSGATRANGVNGVNGANGANGHRVNTAYTTDLSCESLREDGSSDAPRREFDSDLVIVLDMDECLIHSQFMSHRQSSRNFSAPLEDKYRQAESRPAGSPAFDTDEEAERIISSHCEYFRINLPDGDLVHVNKRPNLDAFLREVCSRYETHVFTAAMEVYAKPLLDRLDPGGELFQRRFYRESCTLDPDLGVYVKDLGATLGGMNPWGQGPSTSLHDPSAPLVNGEAERAKELADRYDGGRTVLVDNNPLSFLAQPSNGILVSNFYDDPKDATLEAVVELLDELDRAGDVRPVLDQRFGLADALGDVVKFSSSGNWR